ncbi:MAG: hydrolase 1, exosortase A system-associated [Burkholderiaceae bacterium]|nr:hydrolase 1, exosortase A system-associated [Burkholderiaceae bacterium]
MSNAGDSLGPLALSLQGERGILGALYYPPASDTAARGGLLVAAAFAEEMNRCRSMVSLQARRLAGLGIGTLLVDPFGTGDSAGEFSEATWDGWRADMLVGADWLDHHGGGCRAVLGIRLGAVMALQIAQARSGVKRLLLWQPVLSGKTFYTQFLRIRMAAEMQQSSRSTSTAELRKLSEQGQIVEVSGYEVSPALATQLDGLVFDPGAVPASVALDWFEVVPQGAAAELAPASAAPLQRLHARGIETQASAVAGPAFWHVHERELAPELIEATQAACGKWPATAPAGDTPPAIAAAGEQPERLVVFECAGERLVGCLHRESDSPGHRGVVIVVAGGPQYRVGAHRQFVNLARLLAAQGHPVLRFDLRGMGDSSGVHLGFQQSSADIRAAVDALLRNRPDVRDVVLIGECESASGILFYAWQDPRVGGAVLINPWVRSAEGQAQVIIKRYYLDRLRSPDFWRKLFSLRVDVKESVRSFVRALHDFVQGRRRFKADRLAAADEDMARLPLHAKTAAGLSRFKGRALLLMSGQDYIAREFDEVTAASAAWSGLLDSPRLVRRDLADADHTFSRREWKDAAAATIVEWVRCADAPLAQSSRKDSTHIANKYA